MTHLTSTYRFQFHREFRFEDLLHIIPYLQKLGVATVYASPIFKAVPGSTHGYDGLDPHEINPEVGTIEALRDISKQLKAGDMNWLQDIVPNHMAFHSNNHLLMDVLEKGPQSLYASFFDITWTNPMHQGRLMIPFLGASLDEVIKKGELKIGYEGHQFVFKYYDAAYPLQPLSYLHILQASSQQMPDAVQQLLEQLPKTEEVHTYTAEWNEVKMQLGGLVKNDVIKHFIDSCLASVNGDHELIKKIADQQSYRLCHWQETDKKINYRRFFTVNGLICLNIQDPQVFESYHQLINALTDEGIFQGLRIDHIDGLYDPTEYLDRLRQRHPEQYIVVEKILEPGEGLPAHWPVQGNTGYDFLSLVNNLFTKKESEKLFAKFYRQLTKDNRSIHEQGHEKKSHILSHHMQGELENLYRLFRELNIVEKKTFASIRADDLKEAIGEFLIQCPVYRYYGNRFPLESAEAEAVQDILNQVKANFHLRRAVDILEETLLKKPHYDNEELNRKIAHFYKRCMQFTGPLMAKGIEDTLMYSNNRFIGHNEVGDSAEAFGLTVEEFHQSMILRQKQWPFSMNATSTHDTKRGEDVRARLNVITDLTEDWLTAVKGWMKENAALKKGEAPDVNDEYFIYQTLIGAYPFDGEKNFGERLSAYLEKALREAKLHSNWTQPDTEYEDATKHFARSLLDTSRPFWKSFETLRATIIDHGIINSLSQLLLKFTCPGQPDVYQGCELWDLSLVDPDNRRPVDYTKRSEWLNALDEHTDIRQLWEDRNSGKIKLWLTNILFKLRRQQPGLFTEGEYIPLNTAGVYKDHVMAFARKEGQNFFVVALPLHTAVLSKEQNAGVTELDWKDTRIQLPEGVTADWQNVLQQSTSSHKNYFSVAEIFETLPLALLKGQQVGTERGAGILLHISSLPSAFGIGDLGPEAKVFADFLHRSRQKYWQLLPLNPIEGGQGYSPYSSISSRAGNELLISPELLVEEGLLDISDLEPLVQPQQGKTDYQMAGEIRTRLFEKAWAKWKEPAQLSTEFESFLNREKEWLDDFALYSVLKQINEGKPWYEWSEAYKFRDERSLEELVTENADALQKTKWLQYVFAKQWQRLKAYCNGLGIQLIGDLPFYVSYDSADVWAHRNLFALDENGNRTGMAGVPPDAFSADGQLWGMPVFKWDELKEKNYAWWIERLRKNKELFDMIRLDHFRAFSAYWEVPAGETTARNGKWTEGPGSDFFRAVQEQLGTIPFVAEDLGEIDEPVYQLRDEFHLPGMKVLQFAFGSDMPRSIHIPHNYEQNFIVYTGTHDNNTVRGWYNTEANEENRLALERYLGRPLSAAEIPIVLSRMAYGSVARIVILPLQDVLGLDERARMNTPASDADNWGWRLLPGQVTGMAEENLRKWTRMYNRE